MVSNKGYVVRYMSGRGTFYVTAPEWLGDYTIAAEHNAEGAMFSTVRAAVAASRHPRKVGDVRIFAAGEDGKETPLPTYEEALDQLDSVRRTIPEEHRGYTAPHLAIAAILGEHDGALTEIAKIDTLVAEAGIGTRGPEETTAARVARLIADANRTEERFQADLAARDRAWARLFDAETTLWCAALLATAEGGDVAPEREKKAAAKQALGDLGVNVDALLKDVAQAAAQPRGEGS